MRIFDRKIPFILLVGDLLCFVASLWLTLLIRYGSAPSKQVFFDHLAPFSFLFVLWIVVFFITGLYEKQSIMLKRRLRELVVNAQIANVIVAIAFFYFVPFPEITPKTNLFLYTIVSLALILWWRTYGYYFLGAKRREGAVLLGGGNDAFLLSEEINNNSHYSIKFLKSIDVDKSADTIDEVLRAVSSGGSSVLVIDLHNEKIRPMLPSLYNLIFSRVRFIDMERVYEDVFDRVPLSLLKESWFIEHISNAPKTYMMP